MTDQNIYLFSVWCIEEQKYTSQWGSVTPTICNSDYSHTGAREIDTSKTTISETRSNELISVKEQYEGYFQRTTLEFDIPTGVGWHDITHFKDGEIIKFDNDIVVWKMIIYPSAENAGDRMSLINSPNTPIGYISQIAASGTNTVFTQSTVWDNPLIIRGCDIAITDGVKYQDLGRITNLDSVTGTVSFKIPLENTYNQFSTLLLNIRTIRDQKLRSIERIGVAEKGIQGKRIPAGIISSLEYYNANGNAKSLDIDLEFYYDK